MGRRMGPLLKGVGTLDACAKCLFSCWSIYLLERGVQGLPPMTHGNRGNGAEDLPHAFLCAFENPDNWAPAQ